LILYFRRCLGDARRGHLVRLHEEQRIAVDRPPIFDFWRCEIDPQFIGWARQGHNVVCRLAFVGFAGKSFRIQGFGSRESRRVSFADPPAVPVISWRVPAVAFSMDTTVKAGIAMNAMKSVLNMSLSLSFFPVFSWSALLLSLQCVSDYSDLFLTDSLLLFLFFSVSKHTIHATVFSRFKQIDKILKECVFLNCSSNATQT